MPSREDGRGEARGRRKQVRQPVRTAAHGEAPRSTSRRGERARRRPRSPADRAPRAPRTRTGPRRRGCAAPGAARTSGPTSGSAAELRADARRIGGKIKHASGRRGHLQQAAGGAPADAQLQRVPPGSALHADERVTALAGDGARVAARVDALNPGNRARAQEFAQVLPVVRRPVGQPQHDLLTLTRGTGVPGRARAAARAALGGRCFANASLKRRLLPKPAASAICVIGSEVCSSRQTAKCSRRVCATASGEAPTCRANSRSRCRGPMPSRAASAVDGVPRRARPR